MEGAPLPTATSPERGAPPERPRIYVASLADYDAGLQHGSWVDAAQEPDALEVAIRRIVETSPRRVEEWGVFDFTGFYGVDVGEWTDLEWVSHIARGIEEHGEAFARWAQVAGTDLESLSRFESAYHGSWPSLEEYVEHVLADLDIEGQLDRAVPDSLRPYVHIDTAKLGRDWALSGALMTRDASDGNVFVFGAAA